MGNITRDVRGQELGCEMWLDWRVKQCLQYIQDEIVDADYDYVTLVFGSEGTGKSVLAFQLAHYLDADFDVDNVVFTPSQFEKAVSQLPANSAIVWDESEDIGGHHFSETVRKLKEFMQKMRQQNKKVFLVKPELKDINRYFVNRSRWGAFEPYDKPYKADLMDKRGYAYYYSLDQLKRYKDSPDEFDPELEALRFRFGDMTRLGGFPVSLADGSDYQVKKNESYANERSLEDKETLMLLSCLGKIKDERMITASYRFGRDEMDLPIDFTKDTFRKKHAGFLEDNNI